ncbi:Protein CBG02813 [Caenorhabditis briggsae]|uniref:Enoyl-[acyl-carrier-protein] reductase, mitochondrial n=2 Tax=Caenorhabditis briggsae TaxID=6238 RepID=A0AAE9DKX5_CAEBR|nr:Protein CBG02813 [Caenorhabditis briggsae]ULU06287.1 hypothetical protein L3Y34_018268 [Caenorhabditis briggsae]CAP23775.1 Protein CBG02813 [Caenorhabditis briggsae]
MLKLNSSFRSLASRSLSTRQLFYEKRGKPEKVVQLRTIELADTLAPEEVLIEWQAAPINPADINQIQGTYALRPSLPAAAGLEGAARVSKIGSAVKSVKPGDQVLTSYDIPGTWTDFGIYDQKHLIKIDNDLPIEHAALFKVNPPSAYLMLKEYAQLNKGDWVVQNCANLAAGKQVIQIARILGFKTFNVIRNREDLRELVKEMKDMGADEVVTEEELYDKKKKIKMPRAKLALNGVGGKSSLYLATALERGGCMVTYGGMSRQPTQAPTAPLIFNDISLRGFWLMTWIRAQKDVSALQKMYADLSGWMKSGEIAPIPMVKRSLVEHKEALAEAQVKFDKKQVFFMKKQ